jgi:hypothetical protein
MSPPGSVPSPTLIYRMIHIENLATLLARSALHAPAHVPSDGLPWVSIHATQTQADRGRSPVPCGPRGTILDYVGFYLGPRSPMLYRVHTGHNVARIDQANIIYLVSCAQDVAARRLGFVFTDRHSLARIASFFDSLPMLSQVDFDTCYAIQWNATSQHPDRQEKKQAEFLVHRAMPLDLIHTIGVSCQATAGRVRAILGNGPFRPRVSVEPNWYY